MLSGFGHLLIGAVLSNKQSLILGHSKSDYVGTVSREGSRASGRPVTAAIFSASFPPLSERYSEPDTVHEDAQCPNQHTLRPFEDEPG